MNKTKKIFNLFLFTLSIISLCTYKDNVSAATLWENIFKQDLDEDGEAEYKYYCYEGYVNDEYHFLYSNNDIKNLPGYSDITLESFGFNQQEYNNIEQEYSDAYDNYSEIENQYGEDSEEANAAWAIVEEKEAAYETADNYKTQCQNQVNAAIEALGEQYGVNVNGAINHANDYMTSSKQQLYYFLHIPYNYDSSKSYPIFTWCPGSGGTKSGYINADGTYKKATLEPGDAGWCYSVFNSWYNAVQQDNKYDCFLIYIYPNGNWSHSYYSSTLKMSALCNTNMSSYPKLNCPKLDKDYLGVNYSASFSSTYRASLTSAQPDSQLLTQLIDSLMLKYNIDPSRQYISGASYGGAFTLDTINHYPDRFACAIPIVSPIGDISLENAKNHLNTNIWGIGGSGDTNCNKYFNKYFAEAINTARESSSVPTYGIAQYSFFPGGHSASYFSSTLRNANEGVSITTSTQVLDFMFNSKREDIDYSNREMNNKELINIQNDILCSSLKSSNKFDLALVSSLPIIKNVEYGFFVEVTNGNKTYTKYIPVSSSGLSLRTTLNNKEIIISSKDYDALEIFSYTINDIPNTVTNIKFTTCIKTKDGYIYGTSNSYNVIYENQLVRMVKE